MTHSNNQRHADALCTFGASLGLIEDMFNIIRLTAAYIDWTDSAVFVAKVVAFVVGRENTEVTSEHTNMKFRFNSSDRPSTKTLGLIEVCEFPDWRVPWSSARNEHYTPAPSAS